MRESNYDEKTAPGPLAALTPAFRRKLHRHCARMTGSTFDGEDVLQESLLKAHEAGAPAGGIDNAEGWLFRIAHRTALDFLRHRSRSPIMPGVDIETVIEPSLSHDAERRWAVTGSLKCFMRLTPAQRGAVILVDVLGHSVPEVATITGRSLAATKSSLLRGRQRLREIASDTAAEMPTNVSALDAPRLKAYADRFNAREFDDLRELLSAEVRVELVATAMIEGVERVASQYFGNYRQTTGWCAQPSLVDGHLALVMTCDAAESYFIEVAFQHGRVIGIRDFRHAGYDTVGSEVQTM